jgi:hypothetical protein
LSHFFAIYYPKTSAQVNGTIKTNAGFWFCMAGNPEP